MQQDFLIAYKLSLVDAEGRSPLTVWLPAESLICQRVDGLNDLLLANKVSDISIRFITNIF